MGGCYVISYCCKSKCLIVSFWLSCSMFCWGCCDNVWFHEGRFCWGCSGFYVDVQCFFLSFDVFFRWGFWVIFSLSVHCFLSHHFCFLFVHCSVVMFLFRFVCWIAVVVMFLCSCSMFVRWFRWFSGEVLGWLSLGFQFSFQSFGLRGWCFFLLLE